MLALLIVAAQDGAIANFGRSEVFFYYYSIAFSLLTASVV